VKLRNEFTISERNRFQEAISEAAIQLSELGKKEWWARLYVVHIMRQYPELRSERLLQTLKDDRNELVREAAQAAPPMKDTRPVEAGSLQQ
jgi:hypothetical protein